MTNFNEIRKQIDLVDNKIAQLLLERIRHSQTIMKEKKMPVYDELRENEILAHYISMLSKSSKRKAIQKLVSSILELNPYYKK